MYRLNPNALAFWGFSTLVGYLIAGTIHGALVGLAISLGISLVVALFLPNDHH